MNVVISCLVRYDPLLSLKFSQTSKYYNSEYAQYTDTVRKFRKAYARGVIRNFLNNFVKSKHTSTNFAGHFIRLPPNTVSIVLYNYSGHVEIVVNECTASLCLPYSTCRHLIINKLLKIIKEPRIYYMTITFYNKVYGHIHLQL